jgi:uncharacterized YccA/Bax inhibitor family protein
MRIGNYGDGMANPLLNEKSLVKAGGRGETEAGWAAPSGTGTADPRTWNAPVTDGPTSTWHGGTMTVSGTASATLMLILLVVASAGVTWSMIDEPTPGVITFPVGWVIGGVIVGLVSVLVATFKPTTARFLAPVYALAEGVVVGAISRAYDAAYNGIVLQAIGATLGVFLVMLTLYRSRIIKVTDRFRRLVIGATMGLMAFYLVSFIFGMFGAMPSFINDASGMGILFSLFVAGLAAFHLALDFDLIEKAAAAKMPAYMEWYCALGVTVTLVWLYLEILRLLSRLRER